MLNDCVRSGWLGVDVLRVLWKKAGGLLKKVCVTRGLCDEVSMG